MSLSEAVNSTSLQVRVGVDAVGGGDGGDVVVPATVTVRSQMAGPVEGEVCGPEGPAKSRKVVVSETLMVCEPEGPGLLRPISGVNSISSALVVDQVKVTLPGAESEVGLTLRVQVGAPDCASALGVPIIKKIIP